MDALFLIDNAMRQESGGNLSAFYMKYEGDGQFNCKMTELHLMGTR